MCEKTGKISIVVPIYNAEKTLERCVSSLINQTYENIEIILVNDGSKDNSLDLCKKFEAQDSRIVVIDKPNGGVSSARNAGLDIATGEFVMFCDSDDWAAEDWCKELFDAYKPNGLVMCGFFTEGQQNYLPYETKANDNCQKYSRNEFTSLTLYGFKSPWSKIYSRHIIEANDLRFNKKFSNGEDYLFNICYLSSIDGDIYFLDKCLYHYEWPIGNNLSTIVDCKKIYHDIDLFKEVNRVAVNIVSPQSLPECYYREFFILFEKSIKAILKSSYPFSKKYSVLKSIMTNTEFRKVVTNALISRNKIYSMLYRLKTPIPLMIYSRLKK
ncbi:MAG: glycosyltransferase family 2 protein [Clostridia bacterium]|nr:glycosyltransferase family 2 protein [Clostridia bacterium]